MKNIRIIGLGVFIINILLLAFGCYLSFKMHKEEVIAIIVVMSSHILGDVIARLSLRVSKKRNDYRIFAGVSGKEDKTLIRLQLEKAIFANSIAAFVGIITVLLPIILRTYTSINLFISLVLYVIFLIAGLVLTRKNQLYSSN